MTSTSRFFLRSTSFLLLLFATASTFPLLLASSASRVDVAFHALDLLQASPTTCSFQEGMGPSMLAVAHRYGPCSPFEGGRRQPPPHVQIFVDNEARVKSLQRRISAATAGKLGDLAVGSEAFVQLPAQAGGGHNTGDYLVSINFGTPPREFIVGFDTGSDLSWIQCMPCMKCYPQVNRLFDPSQSSTYGTYNCSSGVCEKLQNHSCSNKSVCRYTVDYGDGSQTIGNLVHDTLKLESDVVPGFTFGCGDHNTGKFFGDIAGLIGLGRGSVSLPSQLSPKYGSVFSYCLPSNFSAMGYLAIGRKGTSTRFNVQYTPMTNLSSDTLYTVKLTAIEVGGTPLEKQPTVLSMTTPMVMDSGTVITTLPSAAYIALREAFKKGMKMYKPAPTFMTLDTCYDFTGVLTKNMPIVPVPSVTLVFDGGARLNLTFSGIIYVVNASQGCLAFTANDDENKPTIIGNVQQRTHEVIYDIENKRIGFAPNGCK